MRKPLLALVLTSFCVVAWKVRWAVLVTIDWADPTNTVPPVQFDAQRRRWQANHLPEPPAQIDQPGGRFRVAFARELRVTHRSAPCQQGRRGTPGARMAPNRVDDRAHAATVSGASAGKRAAAASVTRTAVTCGRPA